MQIPIAWEEEKSHKDAALVVSVGFTCTHMVFHSSLLFVGMVCFDHISSDICSLHFVNRHKIAHTTSKHPEPSAMQKSKGLKVLIKTPLLH